MKCPKCQSDMRVTNTFRAGGQATTQKVVCDGCGTTGTVQSVLVNTDPPYGQGAAALAKRMLGGQGR